MKLAAHAGVTFARDSIGDPPMHFYGPTVLLGAGLSGARVAVGNGAATDAGTSRWTLSAIRTWGRPWFAATNSTYVGMELEHAMLVGVSAGLFVRAGPGRGHRLFVSGNLLVGY